MYKTMHNVKFHILQVLAANPNQPITIGAFKKETGAGRRLQLLRVPVLLVLPAQEVFINNWSLILQNPAIS
nr:hypothetical protein [Ectobacillus panaciterrae]